MTTPLSDLLAAATADARALATLTASSADENMRTLAPALHNLQRRLATATEITLRAEALRALLPPIH